MKNKEKADRLYELLPVVYRQRDVEKGEPLRALLGVIAEQVNVVEDDIRQLYDNWFIETCEEWVVPYIADLIGHRPVHEAGAPGAVTTRQGLLKNKFLVPRREVANTIRNRRRKGTLSLLEMLARDVAGWPSRAVEFYQLLAWAQHLNHLHPERARTVDLRAGDALDRINNAFDELSHTIDVRRLASERQPGRYNIPVVGLFVWRLNAYSSTKSPAFYFDRAKNQCTFSILGNNTQLYTSPMAEPAFTHIADEMNVPAPIRRRAFEERMLDYYGPGKSLCIYTSEDFLEHVAVDRIVAADLSRWAYVPRRDGVAVDPQLGRIAFSPQHDPKTGVWVTYHYGFSADIGGGEYERRLRPICPKPQPPKTERNCKLYRVSQQHRPQSQFERIGDALRAWYGERVKFPEAVIEIADSGDYVEALEFALKAGESLEIRATGGARPTIKLLDYRTNRPDSISVIGVTQDDEKDAHGARQQVLMSAHAPGKEPYEHHDDDEKDEPHDDDGQAEQTSAKRLPRLLLDGLLITGRSLQVTGGLSEVVVRHCTLVPGWSLDSKCRPENETEPSLELTDTSARLTIEHSIVGTILVNANEVATDPIKISISDSVVDATRNDLVALAGPGMLIAHAVVELLRSTLIGRVRVHAIELAENSILLGRVLVARTQTGCVRFCYVRPRSRTPRRYNCQPDLVLASLTDTEEQAREELRVRPQFNSLRYGTPQYCQLSEACAEEITRGADDESEMGVFHDLFQPQREANLRARLAEFTPAGMDAGIIFAD
jgi:hypothetical protein